MNINKTVYEIAALIDGKVIGDKDTFIKKFSGIKEAEYGDITFLANPKYILYVEQTKAAVIIVENGIDIKGKTVIKVENPSLAVSVLLSRIYAIAQNFQPGIHATAVIGKDFNPGKNICVEANTVIGDNVTIGDNTVICAGVFIGNNVSIGKDCLIYPKVVIREEAVIGNRVKIHSGTVVGSDGFGYITEDGKHYKIPQVGTVVIEDDVEIGSNVSIDRARFDKTVIGAGTKIDNLVQIAHNVILGKNCIIVSQVGIAGSARIGDNVTLGGQAGTVGHIEIASGSMIAGGAGVTKSIKAPGIYSGFPAREHKKEQKLKAAVARLPELKKKIKDLEDKVKNLEGKRG